MRTLTTLLLSSLVAAPAVYGADGPPSTEWTRFWDAGDGTSATGGITAVAPDGTVYVAGRDGNAGEHLVLIRYDTSGRPLWVTTYDGPGSGSDTPTDLELTAEGVSLVGTSPGREGPQTVLLDYDGDGTLIRERRTIGPALAGFLAPQLAVHADGRRYVATDDDSNAGVVEAYTADGTLIYRTPFSFTGFSGFSALEVDGDGNAIAVTVEDFAVYVVRKLDPQGTVLWSHTETSGTGLVLGEAFVAITDDGDILVVGSPEIPCVTVKVRVWRHAPDGAVRWTRELPIDDCDFGIAVGLVAGSEGEAYVAASGSLPTSLLARVNADGAVAWTRTVGGDDGLQIGFRHAAMTPTGSVIVGGYQSPNSSEFDILVQCYDADGELGWSSVYDGPADEADLIGGLAAGADGTVAVVGTARHSQPIQNIVTRAFGFDTKPCPGDVDGDSTVGFPDLLAVLSSWGPNPGHPADLDGDGVVGFEDLLTVLSVWGPCAEGP